jgi:hypothetical protein
MYGDVTHEFGYPIRSTTYEVREFSSAPLEVSEERAEYNVVNSITHEEFRKKRK